MKNCLSNIIPGKKIKKKDGIMDYREEIQIAFNLWQLSKTLNGLLWNRYRNEFIAILEEINIEVETRLDEEWPDEPEF